MIIAKRILLIIILIIITSLVTGELIYIWQNNKLKSSEKSLSEQIILLRSEKNELEDNLESTEQKLNQKSVQIIEPARSTNLISNQWLTYQNSVLDVAFDYPASWQPEDLTNFEAEKFGLIFVNFDRIYITGTSDEFVLPETGDLGSFGECSMFVKNLEQFCKDGCQKINENVAVVYQETNHGERDFSAYIYTDLSKNYPSICFEMPIGNILADDKGITFDTLRENYDIESLITNREFSDSLLKTLDDFEAVAKTIRLK